MIRAILRGAIIAAIACFMAAAWIVGNHIGYMTGLSQVRRQQFVAGEKAALASCTRWGAFAKQYVVICEVKR